MEARRPIYESLADKVIDANKMSEKEIIASIVGELS
jgi:hypothetical protein